MPLKIAEVIITAKSDNASIIFNLFEKLLLHRLKPISEEKQLIPDNQFNLIKLIISPV